MVRSPPLRLNIETILHSSVLLRSEILLLFCCEWHPKKCFDPDIWVTTTIFGQSVSSCYCSVLTQPNRQASSVLSLGSFVSIYQRALLREHQVLHIVMSLKLGADDNIIWVYYIYTVVFDFVSFKQAKQKWALKTFFLLQNKDTFLW